MMENNTNALGMVWQQLPGDMEELVRLAYRLTLDIGGSHVDARTRARSARLFGVLVAMFEHNDMTISHDLSTKCQLSGKHNVLICGVERKAMEIAMSEEKTSIRMRSR